MQDFTLQDPSCSSSCLFGGGGGVQYKLLDDPALVFIIESLPPASRTWWGIPMLRLGDAAGVFVLYTHRRASSNNPRSILCIRGCSLAVVAVSS